MAKNRFPGKALKLNQRKAVKFCGVEAGNEADNLLHIKRAILQFKTSFGDSEDDDDEYDFEGFGKPVTKKSSKRKPLSACNYTEDGSVQLPSLSDLFAVKTNENEENKLTKRPSRTIIPSKRLDKNVFSLSGRKDSTESDSDGIQVPKSITLYTDSISETAPVGRPPKKLQKDEVNSKEEKVKEKIENILRSAWDERLKHKTSDEKRYDVNKDILRKPKLNLNQKTLQKLRSNSSVKKLNSLSDGIHEDGRCGLCLSNSCSLAKYGVSCCSICYASIDALTNSNMEQLCSGGQGECQLVGLSSSERCHACWAARILLSCFMPSVLHDRIRKLLPSVLNEKIPSSLGRHSTKNTDLELNDSFGSIVDLPGGWKRKCGRDETFVISPSGETFNSIGKLEKYLQHQGISADAAVLFGNYTGSTKESSCKPHKSKLVCTTLPGGWKRTIKWRRRGHRFDIYVTSPDGNTFRSRRELVSYFQCIGKVDDINKYFPVRTSENSDVSSNDPCSSSGESDAPKTLPVNNIVISSVGHSDDGAISISVLSSANESVKSDRTSDYSDNKSDSLSQDRREAIMRKRQKIKALKLAAMNRNKLVNRVDEENDVTPFENNIPPQENVNSTLEEINVQKVVSEAKCLRSRKKLAKQNENSLPLEEASDVISNYPITDVISNYPIKLSNSCEKGSSPVKELPISNIKECFEEKLTDGEENKELPNVLKDSNKDVSKQPKKSNIFSKEQFREDWSRKIRWDENGNGKVVLITTPEGHKIKSPIELMAYFKKDRKPISDIEEFFPTNIVRKEFEEKQPVKSTKRHAKTPCDGTPESGPRVKNVCRSHAQVMQISRAVFPTNEESEDSMKTQRVHRSCRMCANCLKKDCKQCVSCLDKKKYGGPAKVKRRCIYRICQNPRTDIKTSANSDCSSGLSCVETENTITTKSSEKTSELVTESEESRVSSPAIFAKQPLKKSKLKVAENKEKISKGERLNIDYWHDYATEDTTITGFPIISTELPDIEGLCFRCGSAGLQQLIFCSLCCEGIHPFCLNEGELTKSQVESYNDSFICQRCVVCHVCGTAGLEPLMQCNNCLKYFHAECVGPTDHNICEDKMLPWIQSLYADLRGSVAKQYLYPAEDDYVPDETVTYHVLDPYDHIRAYVPLFRSAPTKRDKAYLSDDSSSSDDSDDEYIRYTTNVNLDEGEETDSADEGPIDEYQVLGYKKIRTHEDVSQKLSLSEVLLCHQYDMFSELEFGRISKKYILPKENKVLQKDVTRKHEMNVNLFIKNSVKRRRVQITELKEQLKLEKLLAERKKLWEQKRLNYKPTTLPSIKYNNKKYYWEREVEDGCKQEVKWDNGIVDYFPPSLEELPSLKNAALKGLSFVKVEQLPLPNVKMKDGSVKVSKSKKYALTSDKASNASKTMKIKSTKSEATLYHSVDQAPILKITSASDITPRNLNQNYESKFQNKKRHNKQNPLKLSKLPGKSKTMKETSVTKPITTLNHSATQVQIFEPNSAPQSIHQGVPHNIHPNSIQNGTHQNIPNNPNKEIDWSAMDEIVEFFSTDAKKSTPDYNATSDITLSANYMDGFEDSIAIEINEPANESCDISIEISEPISFEPHKNLFENTAVISVPHPDNELKAKRKLVSNEASTSKKLKQYSKLNSSDVQASTKLKVTSELSLTTTTSTQNKSRKKFNKTVNESAMKESNTSPVKSENVMKTVKSPNSNKTPVKSGNIMKTIKTPIYSEYVRKKMKPIKSSNSNKTPVKLDNGMKDIISPNSNKTPVYSEYVMKSMKPIKSPNSNKTPVKLENLMENMKPIKSNMSSPTANKREIKTSMNSTSVKLDSVNERVTKSDTNMATRPRRRTIGRASELASIRKSLLD